MSSRKRTFASADEKVIENLTAQRHSINTKRSYNHSFSIVHQFVKEREPNLQMNDFSENTILLFTFAFGEH
jgi:hypothetical protein